jgi:hypothetical protein
MMDANGGSCTRDFKFLVENCTYRKLILVEMKVAGIESL